MSNNTMEINCSSIDQGMVTDKGRTPDHVEADVKLVDHVVTRTTMSERINEITYTKPIQSEHFQYEQPPCTTKTTRACQIPHL